MNINKEIFINVTAGSTRIAITHDGNLSELFIELPDHRRMVGGIYKGKIQNVIPGMQAAFVDIDYEINAFLPFSEMGNQDNLNNFSFSESDDQEVTSKSTKKKKTVSDPSKQLKIGNDLLVQVIKEPFSGKGPRITTDISIPGSLMVLVPNTNYIGISRRITDKYEKRRLRKAVSGFKPKNYGLIVRTIAEGKDQSLLQADFDRVWERWEEMEQKMKKKKAPNLVYKDFATSDQVIRDLFSSEINKLTVDFKPLYKRIYNYLKEVNPKQIDSLILHKNKTYIFNTHGIEEQINKSLKKKVWLKSGAHLAIEHTEAMVVIDVNSGRYIGKKDHEQNSLKINIEAAIEVARQLKLRDIGGLIVIDFIDLQESKNRKKVFDELKKALKSDRAKVSLTEFSTFGLLEMTRQRIRNNLLHTVTVDCDICNSLGRVSSNDTILTNIENWIKKFREKNKDRRLIIQVHPEMEKFISKSKAKAIKNFMWDNWMIIDIKADQSIHQGKFKVFSKKRKSDVTSEV